jgi:Arc/MetJ family transcription regulator
MSKTTVHIADSLLAAAKQRAAEQHTTLRDVVETALREFLEADPPTFRLKKRSVSGSGLSAEFADKPFDALLDASYESPGD